MQKMLTKPIKNLLLTSLKSTSKFSLLELLGAKSNIRLNYLLNNLVSQTWCQFLHLMLEGSMTLIIIVSTFNRRHLLQARLITLI